MAWDRDYQRVISTNRRKRLDRYKYSLRTTKKAAEISSIAACARRAFSSALRAPGGTTSADSLRLRLLAAVPSTGRVGTCSAAGRWC
jgi:hypothetical protein